MRSKIAGLLLAAALLVALCSSPSLALNSTKIFGITERNLTIDLGPGFEINKGGLNASAKGLLSQEITINQTSSPIGRAAVVYIIDVYDDILTRLNSSVVSEVFLVGGIAAVESRGDRDIGNWSTMSGLGEKVTVHTIQTNDPRINYIGGTYDVACWNVGRSSYALMVSLFNQTQTSQIIKTLTIT